MSEVSDALEDAKFAPSAVFRGSMRTKLPERIENMAKAMSPEQIEQASDMDSRRYPNTAANVTRHFVVQTDSFGGGDDCNN